jgi:hypothetical protein
VPAGQRMGVGNLAKQDARRCHKLLEGQGSTHE